MRERLLPCLLTLIAGVAAAEQSVAADAAPPAITLRHGAALSAYRPYSEQPVHGWRETNDEVGRIGGWRAYAREMAPGAATEEDTDEQSSHTGGHEGHKP